MAKINRLKIRKLGNVAPGTELKFGPRGVVLLGRNGTGKTTLLNILSAITRFDWNSFPDDYDINFSLSGAGGIELQVSVKCENAAASPSMQPSSDSHTDAMRTVLQERGRSQSVHIEAFHQESGERTFIESNDHETTCTLPNGERFTDPISASRGWMVLAPGAFTRKNETTPLWDTVFELIYLDNTLRRFDEGLEYFQNLTERGPNSACIASAGRGAQFIDTRRTKLISRDCANILLENFRTSAEGANAGLAYSDQIEYLELFCNLAGFERARVEADLDEKMPLEGREVIKLSPLRFAVMRNGATLHHRHLSFGQCRLLAFLHYLDSNPTLLIADELVNGMHHDWISQCFDRIQDVQAFLSSQNPLLFDFLSFESVEDVANRFVSCDLDEQHRFIWRNMNDSDADEFYATYKVGLQYVSEILRTRGYW